MSKQHDIEISAIVPVGDRHDVTGQIAEDYLGALRELGKSFELIFVLDGTYEILAQNLLELAKNEQSLRVIQLSKAFGESTALTAGFENARGNVFLTLPAYHQVNVAALTDVIAGLEDADMIIAARWPRTAASRFEVFRRSIFHWLVRIIAGTGFKDLGCGVRAMKRSIADEIPIYGDQHRFFPLLAERRGFQVREIEVSQSSEDYFEGSYGPRIYLRRMLDIITVFFLLRFTKKPLRFFGTIGSAIFVFGAIVLLYVVAERLFFGTALANRPILLLSSLLVVLGIQLFGLGLLGELIIFTHAKDIKEYTIEKIVN